MNERAGLFSHFTYVSALPGNQANTEGIFSVECSIVALPKETRNTVFIVRLTVL